MDPADTTNRTADTDKLTARKKGTKVEFLPKLTQKGVDSARFLPGIRLVLSWC